MEARSRVPAVPRVRSELRRLDERRKERRAALEAGRDYAAAFGRESHAGRAVTVESALELSAVWACIRQTAQTIASLPLAVYEKDADGGRRVVQDRLSEVLTVSPNVDQTALEHWEGQVAWLLANGNCYAEKHEVGGRLSALTPLPAALVEPIRAADGTISFEHWDRGKKEVLPGAKVMHVRGFGFGGMKGLSAIRYGVQSMGAGLAADETAARFFGSGLSLSGIIESDQTLDAHQRGQLQEMLDEYASSARAWKVMTLEAGLKFTHAQLNPEDAQMLETRRFSIEDCCRWFGTPPIVIGHAADGQTMWGSGVEQILLAWMSQGLNPVMRRIEATIRKDLIGRSRGHAYAEWNREGILQMDAKAKAEFLQKMVNGGIMTPNEARGKLNLSPIAGGDALLVQGAMMTLEQLMARPADAAVLAARKET